MDCCSFAAQHSTAGKPTPRFTQGLHASGMRALVLSASLSRAAARCPNRLIQERPTLRHACAPAGRVGALAALAAAGPPFTQRAGFRVALGATSRGEAGGDGEVDPPPRPKKPITQPKDISIEGRPP
jgi:hypothetical protein